MGHDIIKKQRTRKFWALAHPNHINKTAGPPRLYTTARAAHNALRRVWVSEADRALFIVTPVYVTIPDAPDAQGE